MFIVDKRKKKKWHGVIECEEVELWTNLTPDGINMTKCYVMYDLTKIGPCIVCGKKTR